jgi:hypothetical protein
MARELEQICERQAAGPNKPTTFRLRSTFIAQF